MYEKTIVSVAIDIYKNLKTEKRIDGKRYVYLDGPEWQQDIIREAHGKSMPNDDIYDRVHSILSDISEMDPDIDVDSIKDNLIIEPDIYNADLFNWLNNGNYIFCDDAIKDMGVTDSIINIISAGQFLYIQEIAFRLIDAIAVYVEIYNSALEA